MAETATVEWWPGTHKAPPIGEDEHVASLHVQEVSDLADGIGWIGEHVKDPRAVDSGRKVLGALFFFLQDRDSLPGGTRFMSASLEQLASVAGINKKTVARTLKAIATSVTEVDRNTRPIVIVAQPPSGVRGRGTCYASRRAYDSFKYWRPNEHERLVATWEAIHRGKEGPDSIYDTSSDALPSEDMTGVTSYASEGRSRASEDTTEDRTSFDRGQRESAEIVAVPAETTQEDMPTKGPLTSYNSYPFTLKTLDPLNSPLQKWDGMGKPTWRQAIDYIKETMPNTGLDDDGLMAVTSEWLDSLTDKEDVDLKGGLQLWVAQSVIGHHL